MNEWIIEMGGTGSVAASIAPALRAMFTDKGIGRVKFLAGSKADADALVIKDVANLEAVYTALQQAAQEGSKPKQVAVEGVGTFSIYEGDAAKRGKRLEGRICVVTGAAQGFGEGIAKELANAGGHIVVADLNDALAGKVAADLDANFGAGTAIAVKVDVGDEASVKALFEETTLRFGGLDLLVSNAGVLRAGGLEEMTLKNFEFVTHINYTAFFLITKYGSRPMKLQARFNPDMYGDIVQVNSKSGLEGSNKNFAYAGGKFGGIGLVQSFAKELVTDRIKVNAVCPGNFYEGPLWSDPEKGLFVQYLNAGKVPGAKTVQDVYDFYVAKVPMRRGCSPADVTKAIMYCVEQLYETGQAIPVTGGQNMLK